MVEARVIIAEANSGQIDDLVNFWDHKVLQGLRNTNGNQGFLLLADPDTNRVIAIALWDTKQEADSAGAVFASHAAEFKMYMSHQPSREDFEVRVASLHEAQIHPEPS